MSLKASPKTLKMKTKVLFLFQPVGKSFVFGCPSVCLFFLVFTPTTQSVKEFCTRDSFKFFLKILIKMGQKIYQTEAIKLITLGSFKEFLQF